MHKDSYKKMIEAEKKAKKYFRFGEVDKIVTLYFEIAGNMKDYQGMKEEIWKKIFKVGALHEEKKEISKELIQKLFKELSTEIHKEKAPQEMDVSRKDNKKQRGGQKGNQNARKKGLYSALESTIEEDRQTDIYKNCLSRLQKDYKHLGKYVDLSNMEDLSLLKVAQEKVKRHKAHYLTKYRTEMLCNPKIILLATGGKAPALTGDYSEILSLYREVSEGERHTALEIFKNKIHQLSEEIETAKDHAMDLLSEGAYRKKTMLEIKEFTVRERSADKRIQKLSEELDRCKGTYYAILYNADVWDYVEQIPDAETKHWGSLLTREIRIQRGIDAKIRLLAQSERHLKTLLKAMYSFSAEMEKRGENLLSEAQKRMVCEKMKTFITINWLSGMQKTA